jgi:hypothetical protein
MRPTFEQWSALKKLLPYVPTWSKWRLAAQAADALESYVDTDECEYDYSGNDCDCRHCKAHRVLLDIRAIDLTSTALVGELFTNLQAHTEACSIAWCSCGPECQAEPHELPARVEWMTEAGLFSLDAETPVEALVLALLRVLGAEGGGK